MGLMPGANRLAEGFAAFPGGNPAAGAGMPEGEVVILVSAERATALDVVMDPTRGRWFALDVNAPRASRDLQRRPHSWRLQENANAGMPIEPGRVSSRKETDFDPRAVDSLFRSRRAVDETIWRDTHLDSLFAEDCCGLSDERLALYQD